MEARLFIQVAKKKYLRNFEEPKLICVIVQSKGWLSTIVCCSVAKINDLWDLSMDQRKVRGSGPLLWSGWL